MYSPCAVDSKYSHEPDHKYHKMVMNLPILTPDPSYIEKDWPEKL